MTHIEIEFDTAPLTWWTENDGKMYAQGLDGFIMYRVEPIRTETVDLTNDFVTMAFGYKRPTSKTVTHYSVSIGIRGLTSDCEDPVRYVDRHYESLIREAVNVTITKDPE